MNMKETMIIVMNMNMNMDMGMNVNMNIHISINMIVMRHVHTILNRIMHINIDIIIH